MHHDVQGTLPVEIRTGCWPTQGMLRARGQMTLTGRPNHVVASGVCYKSSTQAWPEEDIDVQHVSQNP